MQRKKISNSRQVGWLEQGAALATSMVWTGVVLLIIGFIWAYQDAQARWEIVWDRSSAIPVTLNSANTASSSGSSMPVPNALARQSPPTIKPVPTNPPTPISDYSIADTPGSPLELLPETPLEGQSVSLPAASGRPSKEISASPTNVPFPVTSPLPNANVPEQSGQSAATTTSSLPPAADRGPTRIIIESAGIDTSVVPVGWSVLEQNGRKFSVWDVASFAAGWHETSAFPGQSGNTVLAGHNNLKGEVFRYLVDVQEGDEVDLYVGDEVYRYYVEHRLIVKEKGEPLEVRQQNAQWIAPTDDARVTLVTCWPYTSNTHRVIVVAKPRPL
jgi:sortase A